MRAELMRRVRATERPVVVFDLDSTLFSTSRRHHAIALDFAEAHGDGAFAALAARLTPEDFGWTVTAPFERAGAPAAALQALDAFWRERFFSGDYLDRDAPTPGAVELARKVHAAGAWVTYLTGRHLPEMGPPTLVALQRWGFPIATGRANLHMKPNAAVADLAFKRLALEEIDRWGTVVATFENDPANANHLVARYPDALNVLLDTVCALDAPEPDARLVRIRDFLPGSAPG